MPAASDSLTTLTAALELLTAFRDHFAAMAWREPASDWALDTRDIITRADIAPDQRLAAATRLIDHAAEALDRESYEDRGGLGERYIRFNIDSAARAAGGTA